MDIVVLMKQIPDTEAPVDIAESGVCLNEEDLKWAINPYDEYALEEALLIKESRDDVTVTVVTVGPDRVSEAIRVAYAMGVDNAIHINDEIDDEVFGAVDAFTTSTILARAIKELPCDLIIAGTRAVDDDNYMVPASVSKMLGVPMISNVAKQDIDGSSITCEQAIDGGVAVLKADLPILMTAAKGINEPRYPAFRAIMKAKKKKVEEKELDDLGFDAEEELGRAGAKVKIRTMAYPEARAAGKVIEGGSPVEKAAELVRLLKEEACVI